MTSPLIFTKVVGLLEVFELLVICLFPIALVSSITFSGIILFLGIVLFSLLYILKQKNDLLFSELNSVHWAFLIYIFIFSLSSFINAGLAKAFHMFCRTCQDYFVFLWIVSIICKFKNNSNSSKVLTILKLIFLFSGLLSILYGLCQYFHFDFFHRQSDISKLSGFHKNPYSYGGQLIIFLFLFLNEFLTTHNKSIIKSLFFLLSIATLFCVLNTFERAVILGILFGLFFYFILLKYDIKKMLFASSVISTVILIAIYFNRKLCERFKNIFLTLKLKSNVRFKLWNIALSIWKRNIFFGVSEFPNVVHEPENGSRVQILTHAHNVYLQILVTHGIVGLLAFLNLFIAIFKTLLSNTNSKYVICLLAILFSFSFEGIFEYFWGDSEVRYLLLYFIGFVLAQVGE